MSVLLREFTVKKYAQYSQLSTETPNNMIFIFTKLKVITDKGRTLPANQLNFSYNQSSQGLSRMLLHLLSRLCVLSNLK